MKMIKKSASTGGLEISAQDMTDINTYAIKELKAEDIFAFKLAMCDNEVDRDNECFSLATLHELAELYVGKTVISDHQWSAGNQKARIYKAEVVAGEGVTKSGEQYNQLVARCYILRTEGTVELIAEIEAGIKKEVSVGCSVRQVICSVCGEDNRRHYCDHYAGEVYNGKECYFTLEGARDAYEVSFVAVPAQPRAGVTKSYGAEKPDGKESKDEVLMGVKLASVDAFLFINKINMEVTE